MTKIKLTGYNMSSINRIVEDTVLKCEAPASFEFQVEYVSYVRAIVTYAVLHGYKVEIRQTHLYTYFVTLHVDEVRTETLVTEIMKDFETPMQPYCPEYVAY